MQRGSSLYSQTVKNEKYGYFVNKNKYSIGMLFSIEDF